MSSAAAPWRPDAVALDAAIARGETDAVEIVEHCLARIAAVNPQLNAMVHVDAEGARRAAAESAQRARAGARLSRLDGIPFTVKDNLFVRGMPATWGSRLYAQHVPQHDDIAVERLRRAGAIVLGKTNTPEFALAARTDNLVFGATRNPWNPALTPGGSSGGAVAAVASGMAPLALATDAGGSTRLPASFTGLVGLRPSTGAVPRRHGFPPMALDFQAVGLVARTVAEVQALYAVVAGPDPRDPASSRLVRSAPGAGAPLRIRLATSLEGAPVEPEVRQQVEAAARQFSAMGHRVEAGPVPYDLAQIRSIWSVLPAVGAARVALAHADWERQLGAGTAELVRTGARVAAVDYVRVLDQLAEFRARVEAAWDFDVLVTPASAAPAWPADRLFPATVDGQPGSVRSAAVFATWVNACGYAGLAVPVAPAADGRTVGMQLVARPGQDALLLDLGGRFEQLQPWAARWPALAD